MSDKLDELKTEVEHHKTGLDARVQANYRDMVDSYGISSALARLVDVLAIGTGAFFVLTMGVLMQAIGVFLILGGLFGFVNDLGGDS